jgi:hypothetical protein
MRERFPGLHETLDKLDAANIPTVPPVSAGEVRAFIRRLEKPDEH